MTYGKKATNDFTPSINRKSSPAPKRACMGRHKRPGRTERDCPFFRTLKQVDTRYSSGASFMILTSLQNWLSRRNPLSLANPDSQAYGRLKSGEVELRLKYNIIITSAFEIRA